MSDLSLFVRTGTTAHVGISLYGRESRSGHRHLDSKGAFMRNNLDIFHIATDTSLGSVWKIRIWHDNKGEGGFCLGSGRRSVIKTCCMYTASDLYSSPLPQACLRRGCRSTCWSKTCRLTAASTSWLRSGYQLTMKELVDGWRLKWRPQVRAEHLNDCFVLSNCSHQRFSFFCTLRGGCASSSASTA